MVIGHWWVLVIASVGILANAKAACKGNWAKTSGGCYWFSTNTATFHEAFTSCFAKKSTLLELKGKWQEKWIRFQSLLRGYDGVWIGATDLLHEGTYVYPSNGSKIRYSNWEGRQPGGGKKENCAVLALKSAGWHDYPCKHKFHYICVKH
ncbi:C-type lectin domain family 3 member A-like [Ostrea edulis]|uniref:C-type lectin domain family 3 member A-like n=1 Tax=Ostrea edulis TaxID=37623 RepID=UPI0024AED5F0|nr:C-type lectin domain family 3 member A-like [Ostrea edulis]